MKIDRIRVLKDGSEVDELEYSVVLIIKTKCPGKWVIKDTETGESYRANGSSEIGKMFSKIEDGEDE